MRAEEIFREFEKEKGYDPATTSDCELTNWLVNKLIEERTKNILTERKHFAGLAMQGLLSIYDNGTGLVPNQENVTYMAKLSVLASDELLKQLEK